MKDGGQAFPRPTSADANRHGEPTWRINCAEGMSLRDYFAAKALLGQLAAEAHQQSSGIRPLSSNDANVYARVAYDLADAMLKAREPS